MRKTSKLPRQNHNGTRILAICLVVAILLGAGAAIFISVRSNRTIDALEARIAQLEDTNVFGASVVASNTAYAPEDAAAEYSDGIVTVGEASQSYSVIAGYYEMLGSDPAEYAETAKREVIDSLVEDKILAAKAKEYGVYELSEEKKAELAEQVREGFNNEVEYYMAFRFDDSTPEDRLREETIAYLAENGMSYDDMFAQASADVWRESLREKIVADVTVTEEDVRAYYDKQLETAKMTYAADFSMYELDREFGNAVVYNPAGVRTVQSILIPFSTEQIGSYIALQAALESGDTFKQAEIDALYEQIRPQAQAVLDRARAGEDFAALMDEYGADENMKVEPMRSTGYYVSANSTAYSPDFVNAAMALQSVGDISDLVRVDSGFNILRYSGDVPEGEVPYENVREALTAGCLEEKKNEKYNAQVAEWMQNANIVYHLDRF